METNDWSRTALISTLGTEPQVVTLTLDALLARGNLIERSVVLHTLDTVSPIREALSALLREFSDYQAYSGKILFVPHALSGVSGALSDVVSASDLETAFQSIYVLIRQLKHAGWTIHLSIAGGRKSLSFTALSVAQILFDSSDAVWHLVSERDLVVSGAFHSTIPGQVTLVPIPVRVWQRPLPDGTMRIHSFLQDSLTPAERAVAMLLIREGLSNQSLAARLNKSVRTVENQLSHIYAKAERELGVAGRVDRVVLLSLMSGIPYED